MLTSERSRAISQKIASLVDDALKAQGKSARAVSMEVVGHDGLIRDIKAGRIPSYDRLRALFDYLGIDMYLGEPRPNQPGPEPNVVGFAEAAAMIDGSWGFSEGFVTIPYHKQTGDALNLAPFALSRSWLKSQELEEGGLCVVRLLEDNPRLELLGGDLALVDTRKPVRATGEPMAFFPSLNSGVKVAPLFEVPGKGYVMQDPNTGDLYKPDNWGTFILVGRLVAHWRMHAYSNHQKIELLNKGN